MFNIPIRVIEKVPKVLIYKINWKRTTRNQFKRNRYAERVIRNKTLKVLKYISIWIFILFFIMLVIANKWVSANNDILTNLNLDNCRITQDEDEHIKKGNGSMFAYDIACIRWKSFEVKTPNYFDKYVIDHIWYDGRLWNFIIIKHWEYRITYAHTITKLKVWDRLKNNEIIWTINKSGISENYHLHIELWKRYSNIKFQELSWWELIANSKSLNLRIQRDIESDIEVNEKILEFISRYEWLRLKSYFDIKHYSIWYWSKAKYRWEIITKEKAEKRARTDIEAIRKRYDLKANKIEIQTAVVSYVYNIWSLTDKQIRLLQNKYYKALWNDFKLYNWYYKEGKKIILGWLKKRRNAESILLTKS